MDILLDTLSVLATIIILVTIYLLPTIIVILRRKKHPVPIILVNIFLGWNLIGWAVALAWAHWGGRRPPKEHPEDIYP